MTGLLIRGAVCLRASEHCATVAIETRKTHLLVAQNILKHRVAKADAC